MTLPDYVNPELRERYEHLSPSRKTIIRQYFEMRDSKTLGDNPVRTVAVAIGYRLDSNKTNTHVALVLQEFFN